MSERIEEFVPVEADMQARREIEWTAARRDGKVMCRSGCDRGWFAVNGMDGPRSKKCIVCDGTGWVPPISAEGAL